MIGDVSIVHTSTCEHVLLATTVYFIKCCSVTVCVSVMFLQDARDDVGGAQNAGMLGILVRTGKKKIDFFHQFIPMFRHVYSVCVSRHSTSSFCCLSGKYREGDENKINPPPYLTCDSFPDAVEHILKNLL